MTPFSAHAEMTSASAPAVPVNHNARDATSENVDFKADRITPAEAVQLLSPVTSSPDANSRFSTSIEGPVATGLF
jgi:hypothetical protein